MNKKIFRYMPILVIIFLVIIIKVSLGNIKNTSFSNEQWVAYFAPSYTNISYGDTEAMIVKFDNNGNSEVIKEKAYPFSSVLSYKNDIIYQNVTGVASLNSQKSLDNISGNKGTIGYNMSGVLKNKDLFYFLSNRSFKDDTYYSSIIVGNLESQNIYEIEGFINNYGNDNDNIYLITSDLIDKNLKKVRKISIDEENNIEIKEETFILDDVVSGNNIMTITDDFIYSFCIKESIGVSILKISVDTLKLDSVIDVIKFNQTENSDKYYPASKNSIFEIENKLYYPTLNGEVYSFDLISKNFKMEFVIDNYKFDEDLNLMSSYNDTDETISFLFFENSKEKYFLSVYNLDGTLKESRYLDNINVPDKMYPHSFNKV